jgi:hypothetical protein
MDTTAVEEVENGTILPSELLAHVCGFLSFSACVLFRFSFLFCAVFAHSYFFVLHSSFFFLFSSNLGVLIFGA